MDYERVKNVFAANQEWLCAVGGDDPALLVASCVKGPRALRDDVKSIPPLTDDRPYIQYYDGPRDFDIGYFEASYPCPKLSIINADSAQDKAALAKAAKILQTLSRFQYFGSNDALLNELTNAEQRWDILSAYPNSHYFQTVT